MTDLLVKSIRPGEYRNMTAFTNDYYKHILQNESTLISPILGIFTINLSGDSDQIDPINFLLMKNIIPQCPSNNWMIFDLKGSTYGRRTIKPKSELSKIYSLPKEILTSPLKDWDFNEGIKSLDLWKSHPNESKNLLSQLERDVQLFSRHNLMDYSLLIFMFFGEEEFSQQKFPHSYLQRDVEVEIDGKSKRINRYICIGIIDYLTNFNLMKVMEETIKKTYQHNPSAVHPDLYMKRFIKQCKKVIGL
jgi:hypothetical protein